MNDLRRLNALRTRVRASHYRCRLASARVGDPTVRTLLDQAAASRWRLARAIDAFLVSQPFETPSRLAPTWRDRLSCLALRVRVACSTDLDRLALRWLAEDSAQLRHGVEIGRALTWSLEISDFLTDGLHELKQVQRGVARAALEPRHGAHAAGARTLATT